MRRLRPRPPFHAVAAAAPAASPAARARGAGRSAAAQGARPAASRGHGGDGKVTPLLHPFLDARTIAQVPARASRPRPPSRARAAAVRVPRASATLAARARAAAMRRRIAAAPARPPAPEARSRARPRCSSDGTGVVPWHQLARHRERQVLRSCTGCRWRAEDALARCMEKVDHHEQPEAADCAHELGGTGAAAPPSPSALARRLVPS